MQSSSVQNHIELFFIGTAGISALTIFFLLSSWAAGGTDFFHRALLGDTLLPAFAALFISGVAVAMRRSGRTRNANMEFRATKAPAIR